MSLSSNSLTSKTLSRSSSASMGSKSSKSGVGEASFSFKVPDSLSKSSSSSKSGTAAASFSLSQPSALSSSSMKPSSRMSSAPTSYSNSLSTSDASDSSKASYKYSYYHISIIVVILLFVGVNVFFYLGAITQYLRDLVAPILGSLGYAVTSTATTTASTTATGAKTGIDVASGSIESGIGVLQGQLDSVSSTSQHDGTGISTRNVNNEIGDVPDNSLQTALDHATSTDNTNSSMYISRNGEANFSGKSGFCYVGEDRGYRSCVSVTPDDTCMSGDIFPTMDICINPTLRE